MELCLILQHKDLFIPAETSEVDEKKVKGYHDVSCNVLISCWHKLKKTFLVLYIKFSIFFKMLNKFK